MEASRNRISKNTFKNSRMNFYLTTFSYMLLGLFIIFSYVYQSTKQVYLNYEIVNLNKEISDLNIRLMESNAENERIQTNEYVEKIASEKLGMSYEKSDRVVVIKEETSSATEDSLADEKRKISIFMKSLYQEVNNQLKQFSFESIANYFNTN